MALLLLLFATILAQISAEDLIVQIKDGKVLGTTIETSDGNIFYAWRKIPYAKPPLGELRFLTSASLPVMFWIYGGGFTSGSGEFAFYDPTPLLEENVIVVTHNYRLTTFGFLSTGDEVILGNAGLKDQLLALKWTKDNIAAFGGNASDITLFGESAGGMSVGYHLVSPKSRGLFKGAIMESGNSLTDFFTIGDPKKIAYDLASNIDPSITPANTSLEVQNVLQAASAELVLNLTKSLGLTASSVLEVESDKSFLTQPMYEEVESGNISRVPIILGHNSEESCAFFLSVDSAQQAADNADVNPEVLIPNMPLKQNDSLHQIGQEIKELYVGSNGSFHDELAEYLNWVSDQKFLRSVYKHAILQSKYTPVYMYQFSYYGTRSKIHIKVPGAGVVGHANELAYLFKISTYPLETEADFTARKRLAKLWANFAKTLNPTPEDDSQQLLQNVKWESLTEENVQYFDIGDELQMKPSRKVKETAFWDYLWETYSYRPYNTL